MLDSIIEQLKHFVLIIAFTTPRLITIFTILPFFGKILQGFVRNSIVFCLALFLYPTVKSSFTTYTTGSYVFTLTIIFKEVLVGVIIGFFVGIIFWAIEGIGFVIDNQRGSSMATVFDPLSGEQTSVFGSLFIQFITVLFFTSGGFLYLLKGIFLSYKWWPVFSVFPRIGAQWSTFFLKEVDMLMKMIVLFSAPILIVIFFTDFGLGLINRFAPQLNVFFLSMPIKSGIACFLLILYMGMLWRYLRPELLNFDNVLKFLKTVLINE
ncbi:type III secretion system export apparatus subunit SctT [Desulfothermus sp.]